MTEIRGDLKVCKCCGATYPKHSLINRCTNCGQAISVFICRDCGKPLDKLYYGSALCYECYVERYRENDKKYVTQSMRRRSKKTDELFADWLSKIAKIEKPYKYLTEDEWLEACRHFDKCAICSTNEVAARGMFIQPQDGGAYCNWNVIPICEVCATEAKIQRNPWRRMLMSVRNPSTNNTGKVRRKELNNIVAYLQPKLEEAIDGHK